MTHGATLERMNNWAARVTERPSFERVIRVMFWHVELVDRGLRATTWPRLIGWVVAAFVWATVLILLLALPVVVLL